jgi:hypothetical protein
MSAAGSSVFYRSGIISLLKPSLMAKDPFENDFSRKIGYGKSLMSFAVMIRTDHIRCRLCR